MKYRIKRSGFWALTPLMIFVITYLLVSVIAGDFYKMPVLVAFLLSSTVAVAMTGGLSLVDRIEKFAEGMANSNIMVMVLIFILAGCFSASAKAMGAVDATVNAVLGLLPSYLVLGGLFLAACFVSLSMGTSVGTIVAMTPVAVGVANSVGLSPAMMTGCIVGGAMFGDNLSFISDTTIVASRTQGCQMKDKFKANVRIVLPVAIIVFIIYVVLGFTDGGNVYTPTKIEWFKILPYMVVLVTAIVGINVYLVLSLGIVMTLLCGVCGGNIDMWQWVASLQDGAIGMGNLIIITLLAGGLLELIRYNGGVDWLVAHLIRHATSKKAAEYSLSLLVCLANVCTANNTIALIMVGPLAKPIAAKYGIQPRRSASLLDTFSCFTQGLIPYGAQMLMASGLAAISPIAVLQYAYYPFFMGIGALVAIAIGYPRRYV